MPITKVDSETEKKILIGLIISKPYCQQIAKLIDYDIFSASYSKRIAEWSVKHFLKFNEPVKDLIQDVFNRESTQMNEDEINLIKELLIHISNIYDEEGESFNHLYWIDKSIEYIKKKKLEKTIEQVNNALSVNRVQEAEQAFFNYHSVAKETSRVTSLTDIDSVANRVLAKEDTELFTPEGDLGKVIGPLRRRGLMGVFGASKISKTFAAFKLALEAVTHGFKVLIISVEMSKTECEERLLMQVLERPYSVDNVESLYTTWDCKKNRTGKCRKKERVGKGKYLTGKINSEYVNPDYIPCDVCRGKSNEYELEFFDRTESRPVITSEYLKTRLKSALKFEGLKNIRITAFPQFSAPWESIEQTLDYLQTIEDFQADIVVIDYINILKATTFNDKRNNIDMLWQSAKRCADERNICVISPIHSNRSGYNDVYLDMTHLSESIGIAATCTNILAIDSEKELKAHNCVRAHQIANRFDQFNPKDCVYILQNLNHGKFCYDSWFYSYRDHLNFGYREEEGNKKS